MHSYTPTTAADDTTTPEAKQNENSITPEQLQHLNKVINENKALLELTSKDCISPTLFRLYLAFKRKGFFYITADNKGNYILSGQNNSDTPFTELSKMSALTVTKLLKNIASQKTLVASQPPTPALLDQQQLEPVIEYIKKHLKEISFLQEPLQKIYTQEGEKISDSQIRKKYTFFIMAKKTEYFLSIAHSKFTSIKISVNPSEIQSIWNDMQSSPSSQLQSSEKSSTDEDNEDDEIESMSQDGDESEVDDEISRSRTNSTQIHPELSNETSAAPTTAKELGFEIAAEEAEIDGKVNNSPLSRLARTFAASGSKTRPFTSQDQESIKLWDYVYKENAKEPRPSEPITKPADISAPLPMVGDSLLFTSEQLKAVCDYIRKNCREKASTEFLSSIKALRESRAALREKINEERKEYHSNSLSLKIFNHPSYWFVIKEKEEEKGKYVFHLAHDTQYYDGVTVDITLTDIRSILEKAQLSSPTLDDEKKAEMSIASRKIERRHSENNFSPNSRPRSNSTATSEFEIASYYQRVLIYLGYKEKIEQKEEAKKSRQAPSSFGSAFKCLTPKVKIAASPENDDTLDLLGPDSDDEMEENTQKKNTGNTTQNNQAIIDEDEETQAEPTSDNANNDQDNNKEVVTRLNNVAEEKIKKSGVMASQAKLLSQKLAQMPAFDSSNSAHLTIITDYINKHFYADEPSIERKFLHQLSLFTLQKATKALEKKYSKDQATKIKNEILLLKKCSRTIIADGTQIFLSIQIGSQEVIRIPTNNVDLLIIWQKIHTQALIPALATRTSNDNGPEEDNQKSLLVTPDTDRHSFTPPNQIDMDDSSKDMDTGREIGNSLYDDSAETIQTADKTALENQESKTRNISISSSFDNPTRNRAGGFLFHSPSSHPRPAQYLTQFPNDFKEFQMSRQGRERANALVVTTPPSRERAQPAPEKDKKPQATLFRRSNMTVSEVRNHATPSTLKRKIGSF